jgi:release factor glutamine methyltransferase
VKVADAICDATKRLREAGVDEPRRDARLLLADAMGVKHPALLDPAVPLSEFAHSRFDRTVSRRAAREPVARIRGAREFWGLKFALAPDTLDPRPDTESLVEAALAAFPDSAPQRILDLGTGSGCILCALLHEWPEARGVGIDISAAAVETARANADRLGLGDRARFVVGDWNDALGERYDLVVSNPPYIRSADIAALAPEVSAFDPRRALDGGVDGLDAYRAITPLLPRLLTRDGVAAFELGLSQAEEVERLIAAARLDLVEVRPDLSGIPRALVARYKAS